MIDLLKKQMGLWAINPMLTYQERCMLFFMVAQGLHNPCYDDLGPVAKDRKTAKRIMIKLRNQKVIDFYGTKDYNLKNQYVFIFKSLRFIIDGIEYKLIGKYELEKHYSYFREEIQDRWDYETKTIKKGMERWKKK